MALGKNVKGLRRKQKNVVFIERHQKKQFWGESDQWEETRRLDRLSF
jgi:hypothetical protein